MSPFSHLIKGVHDRLTERGFNVVDKMPETYKKPIVVIGSHFDAANKHKGMGSYYKTEIQIDYFIAVSDVGRYDLEDTVYKIKQAIDIQDVTSRVLIDKSLQREMYHVVLQVTDYL